MKIPHKWQRVLRALVAGRSYNRFEAARELSDHCLHSTIATIQAKGIPVARRTEKVPGYLGASTECCRYWLEPSSISAALNLLAGDHEELREAA